MVRFKAIVKKFADQGEKTGWTYIEVPASYANKLKQNFKRSFRVKGTLNRKKIDGMALLPMGKGNFIMSLNAAIRKQTGIRVGLEVECNFEEDKTEYLINADLLECLELEPEAKVVFHQLPPSHQKYYSKWIETAKTSETVSNRIRRVLDSLIKRQTFAEMLREGSRKRQIL